MKTSEALLEGTKPTTTAMTPMMNALVYHGPGVRRWETKPRPAIGAATDAVVRITTSTICGTDLHILKGDVPAVTEGRILGHEGVGIVEEAGSAVAGLRRGDKVLISCITACGKCDFCKRAMYSHCRDGGWILGHTVDGTQAEYVRIPHAETSLYRLPPDADEEAMVMLSDVFPTGFECGVLNGQVKPGDTVAIVGAGPIGLAALLTARFYSPAQIIMVDLDDNRLEVAKTFGATQGVNSADGKAVAKVSPSPAGRAWTWPSKRWASRGRSTSASPSWPRAAASPTSASTASPSSSTWRSSGRRTSPSRPGWSTPRPRPCSCRWSSRASCSRRGW